MAERLPRAHLLPEPPSTTAPDPETHTIGHQAEMLCLSYANGDLDILAYCFLQRVRLFRSQGLLVLSFTGCEVHLDGINLDQLTPLIAHRRVETVREVPRPIDTSGPVVKRIVVTDGVEE